MSDETIELNATIEDEETEELNANLGEPIPTPFHDELYNRDLPDQHPMSAITGLVDALASKMSSAQVSALIQGIIGAAPEALDTLQEIAAKLLEDEDAVGAIVTELGLKASRVEVEALIAAIPVPNVGGQISSHNVSGVAHSDIRTLITNLLASLNSEVTRATNAENVNANAISLKADKLTTYTKTEADALLVNKANTSSIPTKTSDLTNDSSFANTSYVDSKITEVVGTAPANLNTLQEIAAQLANDESVVASILTALATKALNSDLTAEILRAQGAESTIATNLNSEISRAQTAESTTTTNLNSEISRAQTVETVLSNTISTEITNRTNAITALTNAINAFATSMTTKALIITDDNGVKWQLVINSEGNLDQQKLINDTWTSGSEAIAE